jgi:hypothetical protein
MSTRTLIVFVNNVGQSRVAVKETGIRVTCSSCVHSGKPYYDPTADGYVSLCALLGVRVTENSACTAHEDK